MFSSLRAVPGRRDRPSARRAFVRRGSALPCCPAASAATPSIAALKTVPGVSLKREQILLSAEEQRLAELPSALRSERAESQRAGVLQPPPFPWRWDWTGVRVPRCPRHGTPRHPAPPPRPKPPAPLPPGPCYWKETKKGSGLPNLPSPKHSCASFLLVSGQREIPPANPITPPGCGKF